MRISAVAVLALAIVPMHLDAQLIPRRGRRPAPTVPAELPPQAPDVAKTHSHRRIRFAVESYPLVSVVHAPMFPSGSGQSVWTDIGAGTHVDYRVARYVLATLDVTSSAWGGPARTQTAEVGARLMPDRYDSRTRPFADVRLGYMSMYNRAFVDGGGVGDPSAPGVPGYRSSGYGGVIGAGLHQDLTRRFSLSVAASLMHGRLTSDGLPDGPRSFPMTAYRLSVGLRFNPVRQIVSTQPTAP